MSRSLLPQSSTSSSSGFNYPARETGITMLATLAGRLQATWNPCKEYYQPPSNPACTIDNTEEDKSAMLDYVSTQARKYRRRGTVDFNGFIWWATIWEFFFFFLNKCSRTKKQTANLKVYELSAQNRGRVKNNPWSHEALSAQWAVICNKKYSLGKPLGILTEAVVSRWGVIYCITPYQGNE